MTKIYNGKIVRAAFLFIGASLISVIGVNAQTDTRGGTVISGFNALDYRLQKAAPNESFPKKRFGDHLFITVEGGPTFTHRSNGQLIGHPDLGARGGFSIGDWFTPVHGMKLGINGGARKEFGERKHAFAGVSLDYLMNLSALAHKYDPDRMFELIGVAGVEYQRRFKGGSGNAFGGHLGLQARFNVTRSTFLYIEPRLGLYSDGVNVRSSWQKYDWEGAVMIGLGYRMAPGIKRFATRLDNEAAYDNTFYGISAGVNSTIQGGMSQWKDLIGPVGSLYIGKWASTISGWRLSGTVGSFGKSNDGHPKYAAAEIDYLFNINSAINGFNPESRFNTNVFFGPVAAVTSRNSSKVRLGAAVGLQGVIDLTRNLQLVLEPKAMLFNRHFSNYSQRVNVLGSFSIGFQYRLGRFSDDLVKYDFTGSMEDFMAANNMFLTVSAGTLSHRSSWGKNATASIGFGKWFSPLSAWRVTLNGDYFNAKPRYGAGTLHADYLFSLTNLFCGYNPDRVFDLSVIGGLHAGAAHYNGGVHGVYGGQAGLQARFNVSENVDIFFEPQLMATRAKGYRYSLDPNWRMMLGLNYKFGNRKKADRSKWTTSDDGEKLNYVSLIGGPGLFSESVRTSAVKKVCGGLDVVVGHKFTSVSSLQAGIGYDFVGRRRGTEIGIGTLHADYLMDVTQLVDYDPDRKFHISGLVGAGMGWSNYHSSSVGLAAQVGMQLKWRVSSDVDILVEPRGTFWQPRVCNIPGNGHHFTGAGKLMLGVSYKF